MRTRGAAAEAPDHAPGAHAPEAPRATLSWQRIAAIFAARNREFYRDTAGLIWNILMPVLMIVAFAFIFGSGGQPLLKIGLVDVPDSASASEAAHLDGLFGIAGVQLIPVADLDAGIAKVARHQLDLLLQMPSAGTYWVNPKSPNAEIAERLLLGSMALADKPKPADIERKTAKGEALSYADWAVPGVLAMNLMFSSLWGVGWVVVRYRKNGVLRRLKATPLTALEFLIAQILSRLLVVAASSLAVYTGAALLLDFPMRGSYLALALIYAAGALCMISLGLIVASRLRTEELADGLLNMLSWPMLLLSGVWFSMEGASAAAQAVSYLMPLSYLVQGARAVMIDGAGLLDVLPQLTLLLTIAAILTLIAARLFRWE
jgi:ABC-type multidrug transport system permease subunit